MEAEGNKTPIKSPAEFDEIIPLPHEQAITVPGPSSPGPPSNLNLPANQLAYPKIKVAEKSRLCEINPGVWDGLSPDDVRTRYPLEWEDFLRDPYGHRAPRAESYHDLCIRLEPILIELEDVKDDLLIISHASVIRCLLAYLVGLPAHEVPAVDIARGDLIEVQPSAYGVKTRMFHFWSGPGRKDVEAASGGLDSEMGGMKGDDQSEGRGGSIYGPTSSPPTSNLHLDRVYRSRSSSQADLNEGLRMTSPSTEVERVGPPITHLYAQGTQKPGSGETEEVLTRKETTLANSLGSPKASAPTSMPTPSTSKTALPQHSQAEEAAESPTHASKVLPKIEPSLGADEAGQVAAKIEAADTRPTFYENVVEGAVRRKKAQGLSTVQVATPPSTSSTIEAEKS